MECHENTTTNQSQKNQQDAMKTKMELAVQMKSADCVERVKNVVNNIEGMNLLSICRKSQKLVLEGAAGAEAVKCAIEKETGMSAVVLGQGSDHNLGAGKQ